MNRRHSVGRLPRISGRSLRRVYEYIEQLPSGLRSYPECAAKASVVRKVYDFAEQELVELPKELQEVLDEPPPPTSWIPQTVTLALILAIVEARRLTASAESLWIRDAATHLFASPMYRILMQAASPRMVFKTAHLRWGAFFRGTELSSTVEDRVAELTLSGPPGLFNRDLAEIFEDVIFAAVHYTREHSPSTDLTLLGQAPNGAVYYRGQW